MGAGRKIATGLGVVAGLGAAIYFATRAEAAPPKEYICPYCGAAFATYEELSAHIQAQHPGAYVCPYCGVPFATYAELVAHVTTEHPGERIPLPIEWE